MQISLRRVNRNVHFVAENVHGNLIHLDGSPAAGGENAGFRPMELVLAAAAGCASMDIVPILRKQRQRLEDIRITVTGDRKPDSTPSPFTRIHLQFDLYGQVEEGRARKAVELAVTKYCSVAEMLKATVNVEYDLQVFPAAEAPEADTGENTDEEHEKGDAT